MTVKRSLNLPLVPIYPVLTEILPSFLFPLSFAKKLHLFVFQLSVTFFLTALVSSSPSFFFVFLLYLPVPLSTLLLPEEFRFVFAAAPLASTP